MSTRYKVLLAVIIGGGFAAAPVSASGQDGQFGVTEACAEGGTCCKEQGSHCYPNGCSTLACMENDRYWRTDGKPCAGDET